MGIRESLEGRVEENELRLQNLELEKVEEKEEQIGFDEERDISERDWKRIYEILDKFRTDKKWENFFSYSASVCLGSAKREEFDFVFSQEELKEINDFFDLAKKEEKWFFKEVAIFFKLVFPKWYESFGFSQKVDNSVFELLKKNFEEESQKGLSRDALGPLVLIKYLFPEKYNEVKGDVNLSEVCEKKARELLLNKDYNEAISFLLGMKVFSDTQEFPMDLFVKKDFWEWENRDFEKSKRELHKETRRYYGFFDRLFERKMISLNKLVMTENGLEFVPMKKESYKKEIKKRPERRNF